MIWLDTIIYTKNKQRPNGWLYNLFKLVMILIFYKHVFYLLYSNVCDMCISVTNLQSPSRE